MFFGFLVTGLNSLAKPKDGLIIIHLHAGTKVEHHAEIEAALTIALLGSSAIPFGRFNRIFCHTIAKNTQLTQHDLSTGAPLLGGEAEPLSGLCAVSLNTLTIAIHVTQIILCVSLTLIGSLTEAGKSGRIVTLFVERYALSKKLLRCHCGLFCGAGSTALQCLNGTLGFRMAQLCGTTVPLFRFTFILRDIEPLAILYTQLVHGISISLISGTQPPGNSLSRIGIDTLS